MDNVFKKSSIIPVTSAIIKYLDDTKLTEEDIKRFSKLICDSKYVLKKLKDSFIIYDKNDYDYYLKCIEMAKYKEKYYRDVASRLNKSYVWVYQSIVLDGYGEYVDEDSDIYRASLLAYDDIRLLGSELEHYVNFEDSCVLNGHMYDTDVKYEKKKKKIIR